MPLVIQCPSCAKRYQVADATAGKQVRCQQCGQTFTANPSATAAAQARPAAQAPAAQAPAAKAPAAKARPAPAPLAANDPFAQHDPLAQRDPLAGVSLSQMPAAPTYPGNPLGAPAAPSYAANPLGAPAASIHGAYAPVGANPAWGASAGGGGVSNPSGGPTDTGMRLAAGAMLGLGLVLAAGSVAMLAATGTLYLIVLGLIPLCLVLGIAGLISPNTLRAMGKYGGHLPGHYKMIGWGLMGLALLIMAALMAAMFMAGFEPDRPGRPRGEAPAAFELAMQSTGIR
jgi:predicted Zn finger-like uncharacterized protein